MPMGCDLSRWTPAGDGKLLELSPTLQSLAPVVDQLTVISNLELKNAYSGHPCDVSNAAFLSAATAKWTESTDYHLGTTVDQIAAKEIGHQTLLPSLELSMDLLQTVGQCDNGYACVYQNNLSWSSPTTPLPPEAHPRIVFERLFGEGGSAPTGWRRCEGARACSTGCATTSPAAGARSGRRIAPGSISISTRCARSNAAFQKAEQHGRSAAARSRSSGRVPRLCADHARLMFDLQVLALQGDVTRVITFQLARENEQPHLCGDRRARPASPAHAPRQRSGQDREDGEDQRLPRLVVRVSWRS